MRTRTLHAVMLFWFLIASGCGDVGRTYRMYSGPELREDKVCFLVLPYLVTINSLDEHPAKPALLGGGNVALIPTSGFRVENLVELLPGSHRLTVNFAYSDYQASIYYYDYNTGYSYSTPTPIYISEKDISLTFEGVAGRIYAIRPDTVDIQNFCVRGNKQWHRDWLGVRHVTGWQPWIEDITNTEYAKERIIPVISKRKAEVGN